MIMQVVHQHQRQQQRDISSSSSSSSNNNNSLPQLLRSDGITSDTTTNICSYNKRRKIKLNIVIVILFFLLIDMMVFTLTTRISITAFRGPTRYQRSSSCTYYYNHLFYKEHQQQQQPSDFRLTPLLQSSTTRQYATKDNDVKTSIVSSTSTTTPATTSKSHRIPVILLAGFLGSGKTCTLQHLLHQTSTMVSSDMNDDNLSSSSSSSISLQLGVLVNDVAAINIDNKIISSTGITSMTSTSTTGDDSTSSFMNNNYDVIELQNGCACCSLQDDFLLSIETLIQNRRTRIMNMKGTKDDDTTTMKMFDAIVVELSGVADPAVIQNNWYTAIGAYIDNSNSDVDNSNDSLYPDIVKYCSKDIRIVTLIDSCTFGTDYMTWDIIGERPVWIEMDNVDECNEIRKVSELLVEQVEVANTILINKIDIATKEQQDVTTLVVKALNDKADIITVQYGMVTPQQLLGPTTFSNMIRNEGKDDCSSPTCTDPTHSHTHHDHDHHHHTDTAESSESTSTQSHSHSHSHHNHHNEDLGNATENACGDPTCTDPTHSHSHDDHIHDADSKTISSKKDTSIDAIGFTNFVYKANRPFHTERLMAILRQWPVPIKETLDISTLQLNDNVPYEIDGQMIIPTDDLQSESPFIGVLRSKGFCWFAPYKWGDGITKDHDSWRHDTAMYWSHAGRQFGISKAGKWWATISQDAMEKYFINNRQEYDRIIREDYVSDEYGDRRQEIVFIGTKLNQERIVSTLNSCLLSDKEMDLYRKKLSDYVDAKSTNAKPVA